MKYSGRLALSTAIAIVGFTFAANAATVRIMGIEPNDPYEKTINQEVVDAYEAAHPGTEIKIEYLENSAFKSKLPTVLQSDKRPHLYWSWAGGVLDEQYRNGVTEDITALVKDDFAKTLPEGAVGAFTRDGKIVGSPTKVSLIMMWYNKALAKKAGVDVESIKTWDDFLSAVKQAKDAGVTPIVAGGKDKFPLHFYVAYLAERIIGTDALAAIRNGENDGFMNEDFIKVLKEYKRLIDLEPFQKGFASATFSKETGMFGDGEALFELAGNWNYSTQKANSANGEGLPEEDLGMMAFPTFPGGAGDDSDVLGGINGWVASKGAPAEAIDFLKYWVSKEVEEKYAAAGQWIPIAKGAGEALTNPYFKQVSEISGKAAHFQLYLDQAFGPNLGGTVNDIAADLAVGAITPEEAAQTLEDARMME
ncbi:ABC transporter substrate-binding protein [uncultured Cohaesibacter sp.]|uniref:ABC transporter substrate-binding protein n=1 Tax=uncultured Cohaesibacter sp. TaxID=1002546 RepID=UPI0029C991BD|nr:ABC transporter substrate-binding protein [uncultured Cohaesibacter sp.]